MVGNTCCITWTWLVIPVVLLGHACTTSCCTRTRLVIPVALLEHACTTSCSKIIKFQKREARLILDKAIKTPSAELFQQLGWMRFDERVIYRKAILMYKSLHNLAPTYLSTKFTYTSNIH